jgi:hypothetical protein
LKIAVKLFLMGAIITAIGVMLLGHDLLIGAALVLLALVAAAKIIGAVIYSLHNQRPPGGDAGNSSGGFSPPFTPIPIPPCRKTPPDLTAAAKF